MSDSTEFLNGPYGIVVIPDRDTMVAAGRLAQRVMPADSELVLGNGAEIPHVTLYHAKFKDLPLEVALAARDRAQALLSRRMIDLGPVDVAGGKFIFWNFTAEARDTQAVQQAHATALELSPYLDPVARAKALTDEKLSLSDAERGNCERYGHPWVGALYRPHITLGYRDAGVSLPEPVDQREILQVASVELVEVGHPGVIRSILGREAGREEALRPAHPQP